MKILRTAEFAPFVVFIAAPRVSDLQFRSKEIAVSYRTVDCVFFDFDILCPWIKIASMFFMTGSSIFLSYVILAF